MILRVIISAFIAIALSLLLVSSVSAHATQPRVEISVERLNPGGVVDVRGVSFGMDDVVTLTLLGSTAEIPMGEVIANGEGEFLQIVVLPADLAEGTYYFRAVTSHHYVISPPLTVWGTAVSEGGGQGPRDEDDGLLMPMPTLMPAVPSIATAISVPPETIETASVSGRNIIMLSVAAGMVVTVIVILAFRKKTS